MDAYIELRLQPLFDHFDTSKATRKQSISRKDQLFTDSSANSWQQALWMMPGNFLGKKLNYTQGVVFQNTWIKAGCLPGSVFRETEISCE